MQDNESDKDEKDAVFSRLPPRVKREFLEKERRLEKQSASYQAGLKKTAIKGTVIGGIAGTVLGMLMAFVWPPLSLLMVILALCHAGAAYLIVRRRLDHILCMSLFAGIAIAVSIISIATGLYVVDSFWPFVRMISTWGASMAVGGMIGLWARETDRADIPYIPPQEE